MVRKSFLIAGLFTAALFAVPAADAQQGAPKVRLASLPTATVGTIEPSISLSEPAYLFAVAVDRDGQFEILSPVTPSDAIRFEAAKSIRFPDFFTGFSNASNYGEYGSRYRRSAFVGYGDVAATNGSVLVVASRTPFNFSAISDGVYWNEEALRQVIRFKAPSEAVMALGRALTEKGQAFGHDYVYFGNSGYGQFASSAFRAHNNCFVDYSFSPYGYSSFATYYGATGITVGNVGGLLLVQVGTDSCGRPRYMLMPVRTLPPRDTAAIDSLKKPEFRSAAAGTYTGEEARRVYEQLKNRNAIDTYVRLTTSPVFGETEDKTMGRPVTREALPDRVESFVKVRADAERPINRMPVLREGPTNSAPIHYSQPVSRQEPVMRSAPTVQRESKPAEIVSVVKDN